MFEWHKKEKPVFTGIARGVGGFGFGKSAAGGSSGPFGPFTASGGNIANGITPGNGYKYHTFGSPGSLVVTGDPKTVEVLIVAGGGGGSGDVTSGGGGAGGVVYATAYSLSQGTYPVTVGDGGTAGPYPGGLAGQGGDSVFGLLTAKGGGRAGAWPSSTPSASGGSGAGGGGDCPSWPAPQPALFSSGKSATQPSYPQPGSVPGPYTQYGSAGGTGGGYPHPGIIGGGGGGAGGVGGGPNAFPTNPGNTVGGPGQPFPGFAYPLCFPSPYLPGLPSPGNPIPGRNTPATSDHYGGGGGGGRHLAGTSNSQGGNCNGGQGGGGRGGDGGSNNPQGGVDYLGGGSGDGNGYTTGSAGGKGVVIVRYLT